MPMTSHTRAFRCTVFRMLSRSQCLVTVKLRNLHMKPPFAVFATLRSDEDAAAYVGKPTCLRCNFGHGLIHSFRHDPLGIRHPLAQARLRHKARLARVTTDRIEALHASFRRRTRIRSTQTHSQALNEASAEFTLDRGRKQPITELLALRRADRRGHGGTAPAGVDHPSVDAVDAVDNRVAGPWRAFIREMSEGTGRLADAAELSRQYRELTDEERARFNRQGLLGKVARAAGAPNSFGLTSRQERRRISAL